MTDNIARKRRGRKTKLIQNRFDSHRPRLVVNKSNKNTRVVIVKQENKGDVVLASCSTVDSKYKNEFKGTKTEQAKTLGGIIAGLALKAGVEEVAFDRAGYKYHGRVKAVAEAAREAGLKI